MVRVFWGDGEGEVCINDFWPSIWRSRTRATVAGLLLSLVIASVLYGFNWHTFYDTQANQARQRAGRILNDIRDQIVIGCKKTVM